MIKKIFSLLLIIVFFISNIDIGHGVTAPFYNESNYAGLWLGAGQVSNGSWQFSNGDLNGNNDTKGLKGNVKNELGLKTKLFNGASIPSSSMIVGGRDINGDGKEDLLYGYGGKLYLYDLISGNLIWETKVLSISAILTVESLLGLNYEKQIIVQAGSGPYFMGLIDGKTGDMTSSSVLYHDTFKVSSLEFGKAGEVIYRKPDGLEVDIFMRGGSTFKFAMKLYNSSGVIKFEPLYNDYDLHPDNWGGGKRTNWIAFGKTNGKTLIVNNATSEYKIHDTALGNASNQYIGQSILGVSRYSGNGDRGGYSYTYDFNNDGNDEYIVQMTNDGNQAEGRGRPGYVIVGGKNNSGTGLTQYFGYNTPYNGLDPGGGITDMKFAKNYSDLSKSVVFVRNAYNNGYWEAYNYGGATNAGYTTSNFVTGTNYNISLDNVYNGSRGYIEGMFNNGDKDLVVLKNGNTFSFYKYTGSGTFSTGSTANITGYYQDYAKEFDDNHRQIPGYFYGVDSDGNGKKEFIVASESGNEILFYEILEDGITGKLSTNLVKKLSYQNEAGYQIIKRGLTSDYKNLYSVGYKDTKLSVFMTDYSSIDSNLVMPYQKVGQDFYGGGNTSSIRIGKVGSKNYVQLGLNDNLFDFSQATPTIQPTIAKSGFSWGGYFVDVDPGLNDGIEYVYDNKTYTVGQDFSLILKYSSSGTHGDFNGDGVLDRVDRRVSASSTNGAWPRDWKLVSGKDGAIIAPRTQIDGCSGFTWVLDYKFMDYDGDGKDDILAGSTWCYGGGIYKGTNLTRIGNYNGDRNHLLYDIDGDGKIESISRKATFTTYEIEARDINQSANSTMTTKWTAPNIPRLQRPGDVDWSALSVNRDDYGTNILFKTVNGRLVSLDKTTGAIKFDEYIYDGSAYSNMSGSSIVSGTKGYYSIFENGGVPADIADAFVADMDGDGKNDILAGSNDGWVYVLDVDTGAVKKKFNLGSGVVHIVHGDVDNDGVLDILVSCQDGYIYQLTNSNLAAPSWVKDGPNYGYDIETQTDNKKIYLNYSASSKATGYFVQLYNKTEKSIVFDWVDVGTKLKTCIKSSELSDPNCISAGKVFSLNGKSIYEWRVQAYNSNVTSSIITSNGFSVLNLAIDKVVAKKEDFDFQNDITVSPNTIVTYKITVTNDSLNTVGGAGYMNYDMSPALPVSSCSGISDCREKNLTISDYMPSSFTYMPNTTIWIIKKTNTDGSEQVVSGGSQVSDTFFRNQSKTTLPTTQGATLIWQFPSNISIPPGAVLELQFDAIARSS